MKYFTKQWWEAGSQAPQEVFASYDAYFASIRDALPDALVELETLHTLHDSEVKNIACDFARRSVEIVLHGWDRELRNSIRYELHFGRVNSFDQTLPPEEYVESELGDLGYWECELVGNAVQVSMLFVSGAEFRLRFCDFSFTHERRGV